MSTFVRTKEHPKIFYIHFIGYWVDASSSMKNFPFGVTSLIYIMQGHNLNFTQLSA